MCQGRLWFLPQLNKNPEMNEEIIRKHQSLLDLEKEKMRMRFE